MSRRFAIVAAFVGLSVIGAASDGDSGAAAFARLTALVGRWQGSFEWTGDRTGTGGMDATYSLTGNGSAVVENLLTSPGDPIMTTVYHLDRGTLRMTHYCGAQNQPRLKTQRIDLTKGILDFTFVDATNLSGPDAAHVHGVEIRFLDADHLLLMFRFVHGDRHSLERIALTRVPAKAS